jgi:Ca2+-binding RTX toxin-like protein
MTGGIGVDGIAADGTANILWTLHGGKGDQTLTGGVLSDLLIAGIGNQTLVGGDGNDTYEVSRGSGRIGINEVLRSARAKAGTDTLRLHAMAKDLILDLDESAGLVIALADPGKPTQKAVDAKDRITIAGGASAVERLTLDDGTTLDLQRLVQAVSAMKDAATGEVRLARADVQKALHLALAPSV